MRWLWWKVIWLGGCVNDGWWGLLKVYLARVMKCICQGEEYEGQALRLRQTARSPNSTLCREERWTRRFTCNDSFCLPWTRLQGRPDQLNSEPLTECQSTGQCSCPLVSWRLPTVYFSSVRYFDPVKYNFSQAIVYDAVMSSVSYVNQSWWDLIYCFRSWLKESVLYNNTSWALRLQTQITN